MLLNNGIEIRECVNRKDKENVWKIFHKMYSTGNHAIDNIEGYIAKVTNHARFIAAYDEDEVVGFIAFYANDLSLEFAYVTQFLVSRDYQNRKIGQGLLKAVDNVCKNAGFKYIKLEVNQTNSGAIAVYKKNGYTITKKNESSFYMVKTI